jgi:hypothetical protein
VTTTARGRGWAYAGILLGGGASVTANIAHSFVPPTHAGPDWTPPVGAVAGATFWPIALFVAVEILARTPWPTGTRWAALRYVGLLPVASVAAVVSYRHLSGLLGFYGEEPLTATLGPLAVDGLMVMATGALLATAPGIGRTRRLGEDNAPATRPDTSTAGAVTDTGAMSTAPATVAAAGEPGLSGRRPEPVRSRTASGRGPDTAQRIARLRSRHPEWTTAQLATRLGVTERTVRRHLATPRPEPDPAAETPGGTSARDHLGEHAA